MKQHLPAILVATTCAILVLAWNPTLLAHADGGGLAASWWRSVVLPIRVSGLGFDGAFLLRWLPAIGLALVLVLAATSAGCLLARRIPLPPMRQTTRLGVCYLGGIGVLSPILGLLGILGSAGHVALWVGVLAVIATGGGELRALIRPMPAPRRARIAWFALLPLGIAGLAALCPPVQSDGLRYHLLAAQEWHHQGFDAYLKFNSFTNLPNLLALATSYAWPHAEVFQLLHAAGFAALVAVAGELAACCVRPVDPGAEDSAAAAARLLAASIPVVAIVASWPFADVAASAAVLAGAAIGLVSLERQAPALPTAAWMGFCAGAAAAFKLTAGPAAFVIGAIVLVSWMLREGRSRTQWRASLVWAAACTVPILPFLVRNLANVGNPLYFPLPGLAGMGDWTPECAAFYAAKAAEKGFGHGLGWLLASPVLTALRWDQFEGQNPGAASLAMLVLAVRYAMRPNSSASPRKALLTMAAATWFLWFAGYQSMRFAMVPLVLVAALAGAAWAREFAKSESPIARALPLLLAASGVVWTVWWGAFAASTPPLQAAFAPREHVLARGFNAYPTVLALEKHLRDTRPAEAQARSIRVFYVGEHRGAYANAFEPAHSDWFDTPRILNSIRGTKSNAEILTEWPRRRVDYVLVNLAELRLYADRYFRPRFNEKEWRRFEELIGELHARRILGDDAIFVADVRPAPLGQGGAPTRTR